MKKTTFIFLLTGILILTCAYAARVYGASIPPDRQDLIPGIDVSQWQGYIDFNRVSQNGVEIVYIRAGEGASYTDPFFERNYAGAKTAGLKVGAYYYVTARNSSQARLQAHAFASLLSGKTFDCHPAMDFEDLAGLDDAQVQTIAKVFLESLEAYTGKKPVIYSDISNARRLDASFSSYPLWAAEYGSDAVEDPLYWGWWSGWQYTDAGRVDGINGRVDRNYFTSTILDTSGLVSPNPGPAPTTSQDTDYTVRAGDTLWSIARRFDTTISRIVSANAISNPDLIYTGERLIIPGSQTPVSSPDYRYYTIRSGDTLWSIAQRYNTSVEELIQINDLRTPNLIYAGQLLKIPVSTAS